MRRGPRILLYSHDTVGLGNIRRTLRIAGALVDAYADASVLIATGSPLAHRLPLPSRTDYVKIPSLSRVDAEMYRASPLGRCTREVKRARREILLASARSFDPDVAIIDKRPTGVEGELLPALRWLARRGRARLVLGLRDVLDEPERTRRSFERSRSFEVIERHYDDVWIFGSASVFDATVEYAFPEAVAQRTRFVGYLRAAPPPLRVRRHRRPGVLVTVGGGADGAAVVEAWLGALERGAETRSLRTRVVLGPQMPDATRSRLRSRYARARVRLEDFASEMDRRYAAADVVVSMAGYNTVCELLSHDLPAVLVPRAVPVREQLIRARRFAASRRFGLVEPDGLSPDRLLESVVQQLERRRDESGPGVDLGGLERVCTRVGQLVAGAR